MKNYRFFVKNIFIRKPLPCIGMAVLLLLANVIMFVSTRSVGTTLQGYREFEWMYRNGVYVPNGDPESEIDNSLSAKHGARKVFTYLDHNCRYAFYTDGIMTKLPNREGMDVNFGYVNEEYSELHPFQVSQGGALDFTYSIKEKEIPVYVGAGLGRDYPVGSSFSIEEPALGKRVTLKVTGILKKDTYHSDFYLLNSKTYMNYAVLVPVTKDFIHQAGEGMQENGLMSLVLLRSTKKQRANFQRIVKKNLGLKMNIFSHEENISNFNKYYVSAIKTIVVITALLFLLLLLLSVWNAYVSVRLMTREFTIHLVVGLTYRQLRRILFGWFTALSTFLLLAIAAGVAVSRHLAWMDRKSLYAVYGFFGLTGMDGVALLAVLGMDLFMGLFISWITVRKIRKIPISIGVLQ